MKHQSRKQIREKRPAARFPGGIGRWTPAATLISLSAVFWCYAPCLRGPFIFDDWTLPFVNAGTKTLALTKQDFSGSLAPWLQGVRPLLMATYWMNAQLSGTDTLSYHLVNVLIHCLAGLFVFLIVRRLLGFAHPRATDELRTSLSGFAALLFLLHPVQAEAVAYLAGRSESLSVMLGFAGVAAYLYRKRPGASWRVVIGVSTLFLAAALTKEHMLVLPFLIAFSEYWWISPSLSESLRENIRLYLCLVIGAVIGVARFWPMIAKSASAGFGLADLKWYEYFFTQCRALFVYLRIFVWPVNLSADRDFPISRSILDHGAIAGLLALLLLIAAAWRCRRRFPLASYGFLVFLLLMAPTSSVMPIRDVIAERRMYFSMIGLLLIVVDILCGLRIPRRVLAAASVAILVLAGAATRGRSRLWSDGVLFWEDVVRTSPGKARGHWELALAYFNHGRCEQAISEFRSAERMDRATSGELVNWADAYFCADQPDAGMTKLLAAADLHPTAYVYSQIGLRYAAQSRWAEAIDALATAEKLDPGFALLYLYRGNVELACNQVQAAIQDYNRALSLDPKLTAARGNLDQLEDLLRRNERRP